MFVENLCEMIGEYWQAVEGFAVSRIFVKLSRRPLLDENLFSLIKEKFMAREIILNFVIDYLKRHWLSGEILEYVLSYTSNHAFLMCWEQCVNVALFFLCVFTHESQLEFVPLYLLLCE